MSWNTMPGMELIQLTIQNIALFFISSRNSSPKDCTSVRANHHQACSQEARTSASPVKQFGSTSLGPAQENKQQS
jgi:hypothetical protein